MKCGVDEAGRGPLAGPVYAAAVILDRPIEGLKDSKKLSEKKRIALASRIKNEALYWCIASATEAEIDEINILNASLLAMKRAIQGLAVIPGEILVDGIHCPRVDLPIRAIVGGDALVAEISAASILAKTARDDYMLDLHGTYPEYGFDRHKGYPTKVHLDALKRHGPSQVHRMSFGPVRACLR